MELDEEDASQEWMHLLATIDTCAISSPTQFCDEDGYDVVPIRVITPWRKLWKMNLVWQIINQAKKALSKRNVHIIQKKSFLMETTSQKKILNKFKLYCYEFEPY